MKVKAKHHFSHKDKHYQSGQVFETTDAEAKTLIQAGHVEEHKADKADDEHEEPGDTPQAYGRTEPKGDPKV